MTRKFKKALNLYLRGFKSNYIKKRTGYSTQQILKEQLKNKISYDKSDISKYQINYIKSKYSVDDVRNAYIEISEKYDVLEDVASKKELFVLGCAFGYYAKVFREILGEEEYKKLRATCWHKKQKNVVLEKYGVDNVFRKESFDKFVSSEAVSCGRAKRNQTSLERYGCLEPAQNKEIKSKIVKTMKATNNERYGVDYVMQVDDFAKKSAQIRQESMLKKYGAKNSLQIDFIKDKIFNSKISSGKMTTSIAEEAMYEKLVLLFGKDYVFRNIKVDNRYPYYVDFYIKSRDLFIELNGHAGHGCHWFDETNPFDLQRLQSWIFNLNKFESDKRKNSMYYAYIKVWTDVDVEKRTVACINKLNFLVFWDSSVKKIKNKTIANLKDFNEWIESGLPDSFNYKKENTY